MHAILCTARHAIMTSSNSFDFGRQLSFYPQAHPEVALRFVAFQERLVDKGLEDFNSLAKYQVPYGSLDHFFINLLHWPSEIGQQPYSSFV